VTLFRLIIYRCANMGLQCMQCGSETTHKWLSSNALVCNKSETCSILFCSGYGTRGMESKLYCVECNKTRSSSTSYDHKQSSNASDVLLYHAKRTSFSHSNGLLQNLKFKFVSAGETLLPCRRKIPCLEYV